MMSKQEMKSESSRVQTVSQLFPMTVTSEQTSLNYMKRLTAVAVSNVLYLRNVFNEDCYGHRKLDQLKLRILTERCDTVGAKQIVHWVKGCFEAMEKRFLKQMTLAIYTDPLAPEDVIEAYSFRFAYHSNQMNITLSKNQTERVITEETVNQELRHSTVHLLRSLMIMIQSLDRLPNDCFLTMKLLYYDDITPQDYEPPGFVASDNDSFTFMGRPISISAGEVMTPFHTLKVKIRTNQQQFQDFDSTPNSDTNDSQSKSQELLDECTPLAIEGTTHSDSESTDGDQTMTSRMSAQNKCKPKTVLKSVLNLTEKSTKEVVNESSSSRDRSKGRLQPLPVTYARNNAQKTAESNVISKIKDLKVVDNIETNAKEMSKRKWESEQQFEVTQDSVFRSLSNTEKRFKASKANKTIPIRR